MSPPPSNVKNVNTTYCASLLGQSQDVDDCASPVHRLKAAMLRLVDPDFGTSKSSADGSETLTVQLVAELASQLCRRGLWQRRGSSASALPEPDSRIAWPYRTGSGRPNSGSDS